MKDLCQTFRDRFIFTFIKKSSVLNPENKFVRTLFNHLGLTRDHFPALRVFRMNKNSFFGDKYKMNNERFIKTSLHNFMNNLITRNIRVYKKAQNYKLVQTYNFKKDHKIKEQLAMAMLHNENFKFIMTPQQINAGYLMFVYANKELCEKCNLYEIKIIESFGMVSYLLEIIS